MSDSDITKKAIAGALKSACKEKPFDKISVADITSRCGLNRQTFYYHFQDKYELLSWIYYQDIFSRITGDIDFENWDEKIREMLEIMQGEKTFYCNTLKEQEHTFESYLFQMTKALFTEAVEALDEHHKLTPAERDFDSEFYAYGICGVILSWVKQGMKEPPEMISALLLQLVESSKKIAVLRS